MKKFCLPALLCVLCTVFAAGASDELPPHPGVKAVNIIPRNGRHIWVAWDHTSVSAQPDVWYDVYRDGEIIYSGLSMSSDEETGGAVWEGTAKSQVFNDMTGWPGQTHLYTVVYRTPDGRQSAPTSHTGTLRVPQGSLGARYTSGRNVRVSVARVTTFPGLEYDLYRDGELLVTMQEGTKGQLGNGDSWTYDTSGQNFMDTHALVGATHVYTVVYRFFEGYSLEMTTELAVPVHDPNTFGLTVQYRSGRQVTVSIGRQLSAFPELTYELYRDEKKIAVMKDGTEGTTEDGGSWNFSAAGQMFTDRQAIPGRTHIYRVVYKLYEGYSYELTRELAIPMPVPSTAASATGGNGRIMTVKFYRNMTAFPDLVCEVYRDGEKIGEIPDGTAGTAQNGDYWDYNASWMYYFDTHAMPGMTHTYRIVYRLCEEVSVEQAFEGTVPVPNPGGLTIMYGGGRNVSVSPYRDYHMMTFPDLVYEIYRDGEKIGEMPDRDTGSQENGDYWSFSGSWRMTYTDTHAMPGKTHVYTIVYRLFEGCTAVIERDISISVKLPSPGSHYVQHYGGRNVGVSTYRDYGLDSFPELVYEIHRDGVKLGEMPEGQNGSQENGDHWNFNGDRRMMYFDTHAVPGESYLYTIVYRLFEGCTVEREASITVPVPDPGAYYAQHYGGRNVGVSTYRDFALSAFPELVYEIYRDGVKLGEMADGDEGSQENGDYWYPGGSPRMYYMDTHAMPGQTHTYTIVYRLFEGCTVEREVECAVPLPVLGESNCSVSLAQGRFPAVNVYRAIRGFPDLTFEIYRGETKIGEMPDGTEGDAEDADYYWRMDRNQGWQTFYDMTDLVPGMIYRYRIVIRFFDGLTQEMNREITIPSSAAAPEVIYPILRTLPTGEYLIAASFKDNPTSNRSQFELQLAGDYAVFLESGLQTLRIGADDFSESGMATVYIVVSETVNPDTAVILIRQVQL